MSYSDTEKSDLTKDDWIAIHQRAWKDPQFRLLLETDPTAAVRLWATEQKRVIAKIVDLSQWQEISLDDPFPAPTCC